MHCNFLINRGRATASDIETLGEEVRRRVRETSGIAARVGDQARRLARPTEGFVRRLHLFDFW